MVGCKTGATAGVASFRERCRQVVRPNISFNRTSRTVPQLGGRPRGAPVNFVRWAL